MKRNRLIATIISVITAFSISTSNVHAYDNRVLQMRTYFDKMNSPMLGSEEHLIALADQYGYDWAIFAAIAGTESTFGKRMPFNCINPYGWGIYGDHKLCFASFEEATSAVALGFATKYNTTSIESIARTYNTVSTESWISHTRFFINKIKSTEIPVHQLPITL